MRLVALTVAWLSGIWLGHTLWTLGLVDCQAPRWAAGAVAATLLAWLVIWRGRRAAPYLALLLLLALGAWRYQLQPLAACPGPSDLASYQDPDGTFAVVEGVVTGYPDVRDTQTYYRLEADRLTLANQPHVVHGAVLAQLPSEPAFRYGDRLRAAGMLEAPATFEDFDYPAYLARQGIASVLRGARAERLGSDRASPVYAALYQVRDAGREVLDRSLPEPAAALANGILLGIPAGIPPDLSQSFKDTSTSHIIVISGSNIALFSGLLLAVLGRWIGPRRAAIPVILAIGLYVLLTGAGAAAVRAGLMGSLCVAAIIFGRQSTPLVLLAASALCMTVLDPRTAWDVGFQLSVLATLGLILFSPGLQARLDGWLNARLPASMAPRAAGFLGDTLVVTIAAQALTLPLAVYQFGRISLVGLLANFLILPAQPPILVSGLATVAAGLIWPPLARLVAPVPWLLLTYTTEVVRTLARAPFAAIDAGPWREPLAVLIYGALVTTLGMRWLAARGYLVSAGLPPGRWVSYSGISLAVLALPALLVAGYLGGRPDGRLHLFYLPGHGAEAALVVTPAGDSLFFWHGPGDGEALAAAAQPRLPAGHDRPDLVIGASAPSRWAGTRRIDLADPATPQVLPVAPGVSLMRLPTGKQPAALLSYGAFTALLQTTIGVDEQVVLTGALGGQRLTVVKAPGPGSGAWPAEELLRRAAPQVVLWPKDTTYPPTIDAALAGLGAARVEPEAVIEVVTDGERLWLKQWSERQAPAAGK